LIEDLIALKGAVEEKGVCSAPEKDFVWCSWPKDMSTWNISRLILVYNMDSSPNEAGQISEVVNVVLHYKTHSERMLLAVDGDQREFDLETRVTTNGNLLIPEIFHSCALNK